MGIYYNNVIHDKIDFMSARASKEEFKKFLLRKNDVIITKDSENPRDIGIPSFVSHDFEDVVCGYQLNIIRTSICSFFVNFFSTTFTNFHSCLKLSYLDILLLKYYKYK